MKDEKRNVMERFIPISAVAETLACSERYIYKLLGASELKGIKIGSRAIRITISSLNEFIEKNRIDPDTFWAGDEFIDPDPVRKPRPMQKIAKSRFMTQK